MKVFQGALFIVGGTIGAGFISGAELVRFFYGEKFVLPVLLSSGFFFAMSSLFLLLGRRYGGYREAIGRLFARGASVVHGLFFLCAFVTSAGMLAGLDALKPSLSPLLSLCGLLVACVFLQRGMGGISRLNLVLVPLLLGFVFFYAFGKMSFTYPLHGSGIAGGVLYAGMNSMLIAPVLMDAGKEMRRPVLSAGIAAVIVAAAAVCVLGRIYHEGAGAIGAELPFLYVMQGKRVFSVAVALAILTSLVSSLYSPFTACNSFKGKKKYAAKGLTLLAAFALSRVGLTGIVSYIYPAIGVAGLFFSALCIFNKYLLEKYHKKVHSCGKDAENTGGAHH